MGHVFLLSSAYRSRTIEPDGCWPSLSTPGFCTELSKDQSNETFLKADSAQSYQPITASTMNLAPVTRYATMYATSQLARSCSSLQSTHWSGETLSIIPRSNDSL